MSVGPTYKGDDPVAACVGAEREDSYELLVLIDVGCEVIHTVPKGEIPDEFRKYGLPVWLTISEDGKVQFEKREIKVTPELIKEQEEIDKLIEGFNE